LVLETDQIMPGRSDRPPPAIRGFIRLACRVLQKAISLDILEFALPPTSGEAIYLSRHVPS
jgi:hypothetical protein